MQHVEFINQSINLLARKTCMNESEIQVPRARHTGSKEALTAITEIKKKHVHEQVTKL